MSTRQVGQRRGFGLARCVYYGSVLERTNLLPPLLWEEISFWIMHILFAASICLFQNDLVNLISLCQNPNRPLDVSCHCSQTHSGSSSAFIQTCMVSSTITTSRHTLASLHAKYCTIWPKPADMTPCAANIFKWKRWGMNVTDVVKSETGCPDKKCVSQWNRHSVPHKESWSWMNEHRAKRKV